jgi:site-specific DNA-methyltransferase (adenine-specific)
VNTRAPLRCIVQADNLEVLAKLSDESIPLIYIDPPFNTGQRQERRRMRTVRDDSGDRTGFGGRRYRSETISSHGYEDTFDDFTAFLAPRLEEARRVLSADGSIFLHLDCREVHYAKVLMDRIFGRDSFRNEIIWAYDFGGRSRDRWPAKHDNILWYAKNPRRYIFNREAMDRIPYMAPGLVTSEKAARGKTPTDVWWQTIVPTNGKERTGYPTQKPIALLRRIVRVHSKPGDVVLDFFAGSGTTGAAAAEYNRGFILVDSSADAVRVMAKRLALWDPETVSFLQFDSFVSKLSNCKNDTLLHPVI